MTFDEWLCDYDGGFLAEDGPDIETKLKLRVAQDAWDAATKAAQPQWQPIGEHADDTTVGYRGTIPGYLILYAPGREPDGHYRYAVVNGKYVNAHAAEEGISHWMPLPPAPEKTK